MYPRKPKSALVYTLKALIPYSRENLLLSFSPNRFFNELERTSGYKRKTLNETVRRARRRGLIEQTDHGLKLTTLGERVTKPYTAIKLKNGARLMIIFDIPEDRALARKQLRWLLRKWGFKRTQKSVWVTSYDHRESVKLAVAELELSGCVELYECERLYP